MKEQETNRAGATGYKGGNKKKKRTEDEGEGKEREKGQSVRKSRLEGRGESRAISLAAVAGSCSQNPLQLGTVLLMSEAASWLH